MRTFRGTRRAVPGGSHLSEGEDRGRRTLVLSLIASNAGRAPPECAFFRRPLVLFSSLPMCDQPWRSASGDGVDGVKRPVRDGFDACADDAHAEPSDDVAEHFHDDLLYEVSITPHVGYCVAARWGREYVWQGSIGGFATRCFELSRWRSSKRQRHRGGPRPQGGVYAQPCFPGFANADLDEKPPYHPTP